jgi:hypothetical protein
MFKKGLTLVAVIGLSGCLTLAEKPNQLPLEQCNYSSIDSPEYRITGDLRKKQDYWSKQSSLIKRNPRNFLTYKGDPYRRGTESLSMYHEIFKQSFKVLNAGVYAGDIDPKAVGLNIAPKEQKFNDNYYFKRYDYMTEMVTPSCLTFYVKGTMKTTTLQNNIAYNGRRGRISDDDLLDLYGNAVYEKEIKSKVEYSYAFGQYHITTPIIDHTEARLKTGHLGIEVIDDTVELRTWIFRKTFGENLNISPNFDNNVVAIYDRWKPIYEVCKNNIDCHADHYIIIVKFEAIKNNTNGITFKVAENPEKFVFVPSNLIKSLLKEYENLAK